MWGEKQFTGLWNSSCMKGGEGKFSLCVSVLIYWPVKSRYKNKAVIHMSLTIVSRVNLTWAAYTGLLTPGNTHIPLHYACKLYLI